MWDVGCGIVDCQENTEHRTQNTYSTALQQKREASKKLDTMLMKMYTSLAPFMLFATATAAVAVDPASLTFAAFSGSSPFFEPVYHGWNDTCAKLGVNCIYRTENKNYRATDAVKDFVAMGVDGIALKASGDRDLLREMMANATNLHGIPIATFDEDVENSTRSVYVGTDNEFMGSTMARMLKQLRPEGGTFVIIGNKDDRDPGFIEEITNNNDRDDRPHWYQIDDHENIPYEGGGAPGFAAQIHGYVGKHSPTAFVIMRQTPMRFENWTGLVEQYRDRNITYIGTDGSDYQLDYLSRRYVDGLIGQLPYEFGAFSVQALYDLAVKKAQAQEQGEDFPKQEEVSTANVKKIPTNLVSYNLIPLELPQLQVDQNLLGGLRAVGFTCFAFAALVTLLCVAWTCYYINGVVVKASQPFFLLMMAAGVLIMSSTLIPLSFDDKGAEIPYSKRVGICMSIPWLAFTGFTLTFSALFAKTKRINSLFEKSSELTRIKISPKDVMAPCFMLMTCNWIVLVCWTIVDPLTYEREFILGTDFWNREFASHGQCQSEHAAAYLVSLGVVNLGVLAIACWQAIKARHITTEFAEANYIGLSVFSMSQAFLTGIPIVAVVSDIPEAFYLVLTFLIFLLCMVLLALVFVPKMFLQHRYAGMKEKDQLKLMALQVRKSVRSFSDSHSKKSSHMILSNAGLGSNSAYSSSTGLHQVVIKPPILQENPCTNSSVSTDAHGMNKGVTFENAKNQIDLKMEDLSGTKNDEEREYKLHKNNGEQTVEEQSTKSQNKSIISSQNLATIYQA